jgi:hypothetical protein
LHFEPTQLAQMRGGRYSRTLKNSEKNPSTPPLACQKLPPIWTIETTTGSPLAHQKLAAARKTAVFWVEISLGSDKRFKTMDDALRLAGERSFRYGKSYWY